MIAYILKVTLCWLFFYGIYELVLKKRTFFVANRSYLLITFVAGIILPLLEFVTWKNETNVAHVIYPMLMEIDDFQAVVAQKTEDSFKWSIILYIIYGLGFSLSMFKFSLGLRKIHLLYRNAEKVKHKGFTLVKTQKIHLPFSFFNHVFFSQKVALSDEMDRILVHEIEHIKGKHSLDVLLIEIMKIVFWCSPMVYLYRNAIREVHEFLADQVVVSKSDKISYKRLLLNQTNDGLQMALTHQFFNSHLKNRLKMINQKRSGRPTLVMYALGIPVLVLLLLAFTFSYEDDQDKKQDVTDQNIESDDTYWNPSLAQKIYDRFQRKNDTIPNEKADLLSKFQAQSYSAKGLVITENSDGFHVKGDGFEFAADYPTYARPKVVIDNKTWNKTLSELDVSKYETLDVSWPKEDVNHHTLRFYSKDFKGKVETKIQEIFKVVEEMPRFPGCEAEIGSSMEKEQCSKQKMLEYIYSNLKYPKEDRDDGIEGMVVAQFVVTNEGTIDDVKIVRSISKGTDQEVIRVVREMNNLSSKWTPGKQRGKQVNVQYTLPVRFKLEGDEEEKEFEDQNLKIESHDMNGVVFTETTKGFSVKGPDFSIAENYSPEVSTPAIFIDDEMWFDGLENLKVDELAYFHYIHPRKTRLESGKKTPPVFEFTSKKAVNIVAHKETKIKADPANEVEIRTKSITIEESSKRPLVILDGEELAYKLMKELDPNEIATINVLKDQAAYEKYGDKGANGVLEITTKNPPKKIALIKDFDTPAYFPGCEDFSGDDKQKCSNKLLLNFIYQNLKYPKEAAKAGVEGMIVTSFIIDEKGKIGNIALKREVKELNESAKAVVMKMKNEVTWEPAMKHGKPVAMEYNLPIKYKLQTKEAKKVESIFSACDDLATEEERKNCKIDKKKILAEAFKNLDADERDANSLVLEQVMVYPNPAKESVNIKFMGEANPLILQLFTVDGKMAYNKTYPDFNGKFDESIALENVTAKILMIRIEQQGKVFTEKLIIK